MPTPGPVDSPKENTPPPKPEKPVAPVERPDISSKKDTTQNSKQPSDKSGRPDISKSATDKKEKDPLFTPLDQNPGLNLDKILNNSPDQKDRLKRQGRLNKVYKEAGMDLDKSSIDQKDKKGSTNRDKKQIEAKEKPASTTENKQKFQSSVEKISPAVIQYTQTNENQVEREPNNHVELASNSVDRNARIQDGIKRDGPTNSEKTYDNNQEAEKQYEVMRATEGSSFSKAEVETFQAVQRDSNLTDLSDSSLEYQIHLADYVTDGLLSGDIVIDQESYSSSKKDFFESAEVMKEEWINRKMEILENEDNTDNQHLASIEAEKKTGDQKLDEAERERRSTVVHPEHGLGVRNGQTAIGFEFGKSVLTDESKQELAQRFELIKKFLINSPDNKIEITGYASRPGSYDSNMQLSKDRAESVKTWLVEEGNIDPSRITTFGMGESDIRTIMAEAEPPSDDIDKPEQRVALLDIVTPKFGDIAVKRFDQSVTGDSLQPVVIDSSDMKKSMNLAPYWINLLKYEIPDSVKKELSSRNMEQQTLFDGAGDLSLDTYPVLIADFPLINGIKSDNTSFVEYVRTHLNQFLDTDYSDFRYYTPLDKAKWLSTNPIGSVFNIDIPLGSVFNIDIPGDNGAVICSASTSSGWIFTTVEAPDPGLHPVSGQRGFELFEVKAGTGVYVMHTMGVDRKSKIAQDPLSIGQNKQSKLWKSFQNKLAKFINNNGGKAELMAPVIETIDWQKVVINQRLHK